VIYYRREVMSELIMEVCQSAAAYGDTGSRYKGQQCETCSLNERCARNLCRAACGDFIYKCVLQEIAAETEGSDE
jgi:hypothetical protein